MLNIMSGAGQIRESNLAPCVVLYTELKNIVPLCERAYPKFLCSKNIKLEVELREGKATFGPWGSSPQSSGQFDRTLRMGSCIGMEGGPSGTMGPVVDLGNNKLGFLTCAHVFFQEQIQNCIEKNLEYGDLTFSPDPLFVVQPSDDEMQQTLGFKNNNGEQFYGSNSKETRCLERPHEGSSARVHEVEYRRCGKVTKAKFGTFNDTSIDTALVEIIKPDRQPDIGQFAVFPRRLPVIGFSNPPEFNSGAIEESITGKYGAKVVQFGSCTKGTAGRLLFDDVRARLTKKEPISFVCCEAYANTFKCEHANTKYDLTGQYEVESSKQHRFFDLGDSGAGVFVVDTQNQNELTCIGIAVAVASGGNTLVTPIKPILEAFGGISLKDFRKRKRSHNEAFGESPVETVYNQNMST